MEKADSSKDPRNRGFNFNPNKPGTAEAYTNKAGDTLISIAERIYGDDPDRTFQDIYEANKDLIGDDPDQIKVGMTLRIPAKKINKII